MIISRAKAIEKLAKVDLLKLTPEERDSELFCLSAENAVDDPIWRNIDPKIVDEIYDFDNEDYDPSASYFNDVLLISLSRRYIGARNEYLLKLVQSIDNEVSGVEGKVEQLIACPCCGSCTLSSRGDFEICPVCWWEDDGQDNKKSSVVMGGPNGNTSLTVGRINFLIHGLYDPERKDLMKFREPKEKYEQGREFIIDEENNCIFERGTDWKRGYPQPKRN